MMIAFPALKDKQLGYASAALAFATWGIYPLFFKQLAHFGVVEILAHRIIWSFTILLLLFAAMSRLRGALRRLRERGCFTGVLASTVFMSVNWFCFIYAVNTGRVLEASLGYFLIPVVNAIFGRLVFNEHLNRLKVTGVMISCGGLIAAFIADQIVPVISLCIALSFDAYGLMRKRSPLDSATGLFIETLILCPPALAFLLLSGGRIIPPGAIDAGWLVGSGVLTLIPLFAMVAAARRIEFNTLGFLQYITPIGHFLIAVLVYKEAVSIGYAIAFATTWLAIALYTLGWIRPIPHINDVNT